MLDRIECSYNYGDLSSSDNIMLVHLFAEAVVTMPKSAVTTVKLSRQLKSIATKIDDYIY
jgi:hypothetical protein